MATSPEQAFWDLCERIDRADRANDSVPTLEPALLDLLRLVQSHPSHRDVFVELFGRIATGDRDVSEWIVLFCMRELKWPEVLAALHNRYEASGRPPSLWSRVRHLDAVYADASWEDAVFFEHLWKKEHPGETWPIQRKPDV
jgi:hypothetical protein